MIGNFPSYWDAPSQLLSLNGCCGPVTAWGILKYFGKRPSSAKLIEACRYSKRHGTFMIALAVALGEAGLSVSQYSDHDPDPHLIERRCYKAASRLGIRVAPTKGLNALLTQIGSGSIAVVFYLAAEGNGHISPLLGVEGPNLVLPYSNGGLLPRREFVKRWNEPGIFRQCLVVSA